MMQTSTGIRERFHMWWQDSVLGRQPSLRTEFIRRFGPDWFKLESHEKNYPGYDLPTVFRALQCYLEEECDNCREIGSVPYTNLGELIRMINGPQPYMRNITASPPDYERLPVDVNEEESFVANCMYFCTVRGENGSEDQHVAILLAVNRAGLNEWEGLDANTAPQQQINVSVACPDKSTANRLFKELEDRRRRMSIFRGKVIDPIADGGGIRSIGFREIHKVSEDSLILCEDVKTLLHSSILGFYKHRVLLQKLAIEMKRGILFHGPPGTGKTSISLYLANHLPNFTVCFVSGERLLYPRHICRMARYLQPAMVVFEDIDLVAQEREAGGLATVLGELMNQIDGCEPSDEILFVMNTNSLERLERAVKNRPGRVDQIIEVPLPTREEREKLISHFAPNLKLDIQNMGDILSATEGITHATLKEIVKRATVNAIERLDPESNGQELMITDADLLLANEQVRVKRDPEEMPGLLGFRKSGAI